MNEKKKYFYILFDTFVISWSLGYIFGSSIADNRSGADSVRVEFNTARELISSSLELA